MPDRISVHCITRDRTPALALLLASMAQQTTKKFDLVILDNGRSAKVNQDYMCRALLSRLQLEGVRVNVVETPEEHRDIGKYRNQCIEQDKFGNKIGIRIDDDSILDPRYIEIVSSGFHTPDIGIVGGICPYIFAEKQYVMQPAKFNEVTPEFDWVDNCINFVRFIDDDGKDKHWSETYFPSGHIRSNYAYRMDLVKKIRFPEWSGPSGFTEESVFCIKAWMHGYKILINPNAIAWHLAYPAGGGRDKVINQQQMDEIKKTNMARLKTELELYRKTLGVEIRGYP